MPKDMFVSAASKQPVTFSQVSNQLEKVAASAREGGDEKTAKKVEKLTTDASVGNNGLVSPNVIQSLFTGKPLVDVTT